MNYEEKFPFQRKDILFRTVFLTLYTVESCGTYLPNTNIDFQLLTSVLLLELLSLPDVFVSSNRIERHMRTSPLQQLLFHWLFQSSADLVAYCSGRYNASRRRRTGIELVL
jgi:hypothetical protein